MARIPKTCICVAAVQGLGSTHCAPSSEQTLYSPSVILQHHFGRDGVLISEPLCALQGFAVQPEKFAYNPNAKVGVEQGQQYTHSKMATHATASVYINDAEDGLLHDYDVWLEKLAPHAPTEQYQHNRTGEDNADAHMKRQIMGREVVVAITKGKLDLGPWEQIFYGEFDGRRRKRVLVKIIGE